MQPLLAITDSPLLPAWEALRPFSAELWLIATLAGLLLTPFFVRRRVDGAAAAVAVIGLVIAAFTMLRVSDQPAAELGGLFTADACAAGWKLILLLFVIGVIAMQWARSRQSILTHDAPEFYTLLNGATLGLSLMGSASNWLTLFLAVEMASLASYLLAGFHNTHRPGAEASLKYVLFGASVTAVMAYGLSLLYGITGTLRIVPLAHTGALAIIATLALVAGLSFKVAAVPFHFWCPDVFEGAEIEVTTFLSVASKGAALVLLMRTLLQLGGTGNELPLVETVVGVMAAVTMTVGNTAAFSQTSMKRLLAYSSIAQAGYVLAALSLFDARLRIAPAVLLYVAVYAVMNLAAFAAVAAVADSAGGDDSIRSFRGLGRRSPVLALAMAAALVSLIGLPPLAGFGAKLSVLWVVIQGGGAAWALAAVVVINTVISAFYYFRVIRVMYLEPAPARSVAIAPGLVLLAAGCAVLLVAGFVGFGPLSAAAAQLGRLQLIQTP